MIGNSAPHAIYYREHIMEDILMLAALEYNGSFFLHPDHTDFVEYALQNCHDPIVNAAVKFIRAELNKKISVESVCRAIGTNPSTLNFKFRKVLSHSVGEFVISEKMKFASQLLTNTTFSVSEIATRCGFENIYYFSNTFAKYHDMSPTNYRKAFRQF